jgi:sugar diacid utilization regulator
MPALPALDPATRAVCDLVVERLELEASGLAAAMTDAVLDEIPEYSQLSGAQREAVLAHSLDHVRAIVSAIRAWKLPSREELAFVRARGALRASQRITLNALLHSYRIGHRTVWECLVRVMADLDNVLDAALALTTLTLNYTELISSELAEAYAETQRQWHLELDRERRDLLETILDGRSERRVEAWPPEPSFGLTPNADYLVLVLTRISDDPSPSSESLTRGAEAARRHLSLGVAQPLVVVRLGEVVSILPLARVRPAAIAVLARRAHVELSQRGERWAGGISTVCAGLGEVARGYQEALVAMQSAMTAGLVCALLETRVSEYLVGRADGTALRMIPPAARRLLESDHPADRLLVETAVAYGRADMSVRAAADALDVHPNTVTYRLHKLGQALARDPTRFSDLAEILTWVRVVEHASNA